MEFQGFCPACSQNIEKDRFVGVGAICRCGWVDTSQEKKQAEAHSKKLKKTFVGVGLAICGLYMFRLSWGPHAWEVPFLEVESVSGLMSSDGYQKFADICIDLNRWTCAEESYLAMYRSSRNPDAFAKLGKLEFALKRPEKAAQFYGAYYKNGGSNPDVAFEFAQVLEQTHQVDEALKYYQISINARPQTLPVFATSNMVRLLMTNNRAAEAYEKILIFHESAENANGYLNAEATECENALGAKAVKQAKADQERRSRVAKR